MSNGWQYLAVLACKTQWSWVLSIGFGPHAIIHEFDAIPERSNSTEVLTFQSLSSRLAFSFAAFRGRNPHQLTLTSVHYGGNRLSQIWTRMRNCIVSSVDITWLSARFVGSAKLLRDTSTRCYYHEGKPTSKTLWNELRCTNGLRKKATA